MEFGLQIEPAFGFAYEDVARLAGECRAHGYTSIWASDHFMLDTGHADRNCLDCWTLLAALAAEIKDLRLGSLVTCMSYRNPAMLAKIAACVDMISGGRLEFGVGAGWKDVEYIAYGIPFPSPGERVDRFIEGMEMVTRLWTQPRTTYQGKYHSVVDAVSAPKPLQQPHPPVLIGGSKPRMLRAMARFADAVNMGGSPSPKAYQETLHRLEMACREEGTDFGRIRRTHFMPFVVAATEREVADLVAGISRSEGLSEAEYRAKRARAFIGTADRAANLIRQYADIGVTQIMTVFPYGEELRSMRLFADRVIPKL